MPTRYEKKPEAKIEKALNDAAKKINAEANAKKTVSEKPKTKPVNKSALKSNIYQLRRESFLNFATKTKVVIAIKNVTKGGDTIESYYVTSSGWQYIAELFGYSVKVDVEKILKSGSVDFLMVEAKATLVDASGQEVSSGTMIADCDEEWLKDKPRFAVYGLAQTRAISRAVRNKLGWFAEYCGFSSTPYDEMPR